MQCHDICENLSAYIDGMLDSNTASRVEEHLASCAICRAEYDDLIATVELVRELPEVAPPPGFREGLREMMLAEVVGGPGNEIKSKPTPRRWFTGRWVSLVAAAAVIFLTVGVTALWSHEKGGFGIFLPGSDIKMAEESAEPPKNDAGQSQSAGEEETVIMLKQPLKSETTEDGNNNVPAAGPNARDNEAGPAESAPPEPVPTGQTHTDTEKRTFDTTVRDEPETMSDTSANVRPEAEEEARFFITGSPDSGMEADTMAAETDEEMARLLAPPGYGAGPEEAVEYTITLEINDYNEAFQQAADKAVKHGGFVESMEVERGKPVKIKVPFNKAEMFIDDIGHVGKVKDRRSGQKNLATAIKQTENRISELQDREREIANRLAGEKNKELEEEVKQIHRQIADLQTELADLNASVMLSDVELVLDEKPRI